MEGVADSNWRFGSAPDYTIANAAFVKSKSMCHEEGSLALVVENLVKTWEMERSHKLDPTTYETVDQEKFSMSANGGKTYTNVEANVAGNYNVLLETAPKDQYNSEETTWERSHEIFNDSFAAFPWEVLEVT
jgi:hypothetical protein